MITINQNKATEITKDAIRAYRKPLLEALDVDYTRATETGADTTTIVADKHELKTIIDSLGE